MKTLRFIKLYFTLIYAFTTTQVVYSQDGGLGSSNIVFTSSSEIKSSIKIPVSPEAGAFEKYGSTPVNLYTGTPNISLPIHTLNGKEINVPITLDYDASGVKVSQIATFVGLGWNLNIGGRITRISNGTPDDIGLSPYDDNIKTEILGYLTNGLTSFDSELTLINYLDSFMMPIVNGSKDTLLDFYSLNVLGINDYIVRDLNDLSYRTLLNPKIVVQKTSSGWKITNEDGSEYYFNNSEKTTILPLNSGDDVSCYSGTSISSWVLTKIVSKNKLDVFDFEYNLYSWANYQHNPLSSITYENEVAPNNGAVSYQPTNLGYGSMSIPSKTEQQIPFKVKRNDELLVQFDFKEREDLQFTMPCYQNGNALDGIRFFNYKTNFSSPTLYKKISFIHSYFGFPNTEDYNSKRLKLDSFIIYQDIMQNEKKYAFEYDRPTYIPSILSNAQDMIGLYNGYENSTLVPPIYNDNEVALTSGANRKSRFDFMTVGTLNKIIYPTKGYTTYEYEQNGIPNNIINQEYTYYDSNYISCNDTFYDNLAYIESNSNLNLPQSFLQNYYGQNSNMNLISIQNFPNHINNGYHVSGACSSPQTSMLRIDESKNYYLSMEGYGVYLIQKIENCLEENDINYSVIYENGNSEQANFNSCLRHTESIFYNGITSSHPDDFVAGGLTRSDDGKEIFLNSGTYQITIWPFYHSEGEDYTVLWNKLRVYEKNLITVPQSTTYLEKKIEGFRVKSIRDYSDSDVLVSEKEYKYTEDIDSGSSGVQLGFAKAPTRKIAKTMYNCHDKTFFTVNSANIQTMPNVGYSSVIEIQKDNNNFNGYKQSKFKVGTTGISVNSNGIKSFDPDYQNGKIIEMCIFSKEKKKQYSEKYFYTNLDFYSASSFTYAGISTTSYPFAKASFGWGLHFDLGHCGLLGWNSPPTLSPTWYSSDYTGNIPDWYSLEYGNYNFIPVSQSIKGRYGFLSKKEAFTYPPTGGELKQTEEYIYGSAESEYPYQLVEKTTTGTNDITKSEQYQYHPNYPTNPEKITDIKYFNNGEQIFHKNMVYSDYGTTANGLANLVSEIKTAKGTNSLESRLLFDYDLTTKNIVNTVVPLATTLSNDNYDSYIFGYNDMYPVAKLSGVKYSQISTARLNTIKSLTNTIITPSSELALLNELNLLRSDFPNAQITTYTYNPVIGVTSITDPKGDVQYFSYDELGRLKEVKDKNGNKLSENEYHYRP